MENKRQVAWLRGSRCESGACVEVARIDGLYVIRDSKDPDGPRLTFTPDEWLVFTGGIRAGDFSFE